MWGGRVRDAALYAVVNQAGVGSAAQADPTVHGGGRTLALGDAGNNAHFAVSLICRPPGPTPPAAEKAIIGESLAPSDQAVAFGYFRWGVWVLQVGRLGTSGGAARSVEASPVSGRC